MTTKAAKPALRIAFSGAIIAAALVVLWLSFTGATYGHLLWRQAALALMLVFLGIQQLVSSPLSLILRRSLAAFLFAAAAASLLIFFR